MSVIVKNRRLVILRFLAAEPDYAMNVSVLQGALKKVGHGVSRDVIEGDCAWLAENGLCSLTLLDVPITVARITARGLDVASGVATHPGVDRPLP